MAIGCGGFAAPVARGLRFRGSLNAVAKQPLVRIGTRASKLALTQSGMMQRQIAVALGYEAEGGEGGQDEGVRGGVDEVGEADEGGGEAYGRAVEGCDEDFGVGVEGLGGVDVVGDEGCEPLLVEVAAFVFATDGDVGAAIEG